MSETLRLRVKPGCRYGPGSIYAAGYEFAGTAAELLSFGDKLELVAGGAVTPTAAPVAPVAPSAGPAAPAWQLAAPGTWEWPQPTEQLARPAQPTPYVLPEQPEATVWQPEQTEQPEPVVRQPEKAEKPEKLEPVAQMEPLVEPAPKRRGAK